MTQHVNYPEDCSGTDTPVLCIASSLQQRSPDDAVRGTMPVVERPTITLANPAASWVKNWENKPVVGKEIVVREVVAVEESLMYQKQSKHKMVGGVTDFIVTADPSNDGMMFSVVKQLPSHN